MSSVCSDHKFQLQLLSAHEKDYNDTQKRNLLSRFAASVHDGSGNNEDSGDPFASDEFRMYEFKVRQCMRSRSHDWTNCPYQHPGEKARRRDPRRFRYSGTVCPEFRRCGECRRGDACEFSHGVFETWLHPSRYRTEPCKDGKNCNRKICFFAHTPSQLRVLPLENDDHNKKSPIVTPHGCLLCHCSSSTCSPTSTLFGVSHFSPTLSPSSPSSPTRLIETDDPHEGIVMDVVSDIVASMNDLSFCEASPVSASKPHSLSWLDVSEDQLQQQQQQEFVFSPLSSGRFSNNGNERYLRGEGGVVADDVIAPDLAWVNDLLR
ncbi:hypothetical protein Fmac_021614 [Flemingia macrophylla]|uniref:C3H1-type domain-containing protein n=1 Tax=Flemingia macrophylla TaxID=520843 RepID=A0ABD1LXK8_9FABA